MDGPPGLTALARLHEHQGRLTAMRLQGSEARLVNHSCEPNCERFTVPSQSGLRVILCARRDVPPGQELTLDYSLAGIQVRTGVHACTRNPACLHACLPQFSIR